MMFHFFQIVPLYGIVRVLFSPKSKIICKLGNCLDTQLKTSFVRLRCSRISIPFKKSSKTFIFKISRQIFNTQMIYLFHDLVENKISYLHHDTNNNQNERFLLNQTSHQILIHQAPYYIVILNTLILLLCSTKCSVGT